MRPRSAGYVRRQNDSFPKSSAAAVGRLPKSKEPAVQASARTSWGAGGTACAAEARVKLAQLNLSRDRVAHLIDAGLAAKVVLVRVLATGPQRKYAPASQALLRVPAQEADDPLCLLRRSIRDVQQQPDRSGDVSPAFIARSTGLSDEQPPPKRTLVKPQLPPHFPGVGPGHDPQLRQLLIHVFLFSHE